MSKGIDSFIRNRVGTENLRRYSSFVSAGIDIYDNLPVDDEQVNAMMEKYRGKFKRDLMSTFKVPKLHRDLDGPILMLDDAMEGEAECFKRKRNTKQAPLRIGINISRDYDATDVVAVRGAAIVVLYDLCKKRGQKLEVECCYGLGPSRVRNGQYCESHVRIEMHSPTMEMIRRVCCSGSAISVVGGRTVSPLSGGLYGWYRFYEFKALGFPKEYDIVLDRIETTDANREYTRVLDRIKELGAGTGTGTGA